MGDNETEKEAGEKNVEILLKDFNQPTNDEYDPHLHRNRPSPTTNFETLVHLLKGSLGTGILAMPKAFYQSGLILGTISTVLIGILCTYCLHVLVRTQYRLCKDLRVPILTLPASMQKALERGPEFLRPTARAAAIIVDVFLIVYQLGICCVYIVFIATNIKSVVVYYTDAWELRYYMLSLFLPLVLLNYIRNLKLLAPLSGIANLIMFVGLGIILYYIFDEMPEVSSASASGTLADYPLFVGTTLFALEAVGVVIALENNMKTPKSFGGTTGVLNVGMVIIVFLYMLVGFFGLVKYGAKAEDTVTANLLPGGLSQAVQILFAIAIVISYALQAYVPVEILWENYLKPKYEKHPKCLLYEYILRTVLVIITFVLAIAIPKLGLFISLFGALCLSALGIIFPAVMEMCVLWPNNLGKFNWILLKDIFLMILGFLALVIGTYCALRDIVSGLRS